MDNLISLCGNSISLCSNLIFLYGLRFIYKIGKYTIHYMVTIERIIHFFEKRACAESEHVKNEIRK